MKRVHVHGEVDDLDQSFGFNPGNLSNETCCG